MNCNNCGHEIEEGDVFCSECGIKINTCPNCGAQLKENAKFCSKCGQKLSFEAVAEPVKEMVSESKPQNTVVTSQSDIKMPEDADGEEDVGWEYLQENRIEGMECDLEHNFAFISYAHTPHDQRIVDKVFKRLSDRGYNLWIDTANMPYSADHWKDSADKALREHKDTCKMVLYFRSEDSITRETIYKELDSFSKINGPGYSDNIVTVGIYNDPSLHTRTFKEKLCTEAESADPNTEAGKKAIKKAECITNICGLVSESCKAIQLTDVKNSIEKLCDLIEERLAEHGVLQRFSLPDKIAYIMDGSFRIKPQGDQLSTFLLFKDIVEKTIGKDGDGKKRTLIIEGDPGTGKSVLLMYMLSWLRSNEYLRQKEIRWISKNNAPRMVYEEKLKADAKNIPDKAIRKEIKESFKKIFCGQRSITLEQEKKEKKQICDIIFIDEAHRLASFDRYTPGVDMAKEMFTAGAVTVVMVDDNQVVTMADSVNRSKVYEWANELGSEIVTSKMKSQLRCKGSDSYLSWLNGILEINPEDKYIAKTTDYEIRVFDSPKEMFKLIKEKEKTDKPSRLLAGYCWKWLSEGRDDTKVHDIVIPEGNSSFGISWNFQSGKPYAADEGSINQAGCVHTTQGLEFAYVGVIFGEDMIYRNGRIETNFEKRASTDASVNGLKTLKKENPEEAARKADEIIKNTYRVLMSRGVKGCYIYCVDKELNDYMHKMVDAYNNSRVVY